MFVKLCGPPLNEKMLLHVAFSIWGVVLCLAYGAGSVNDGIVLKNYIESYYLEKFD